VAEFRVETTEEVEDLAWLRNGVADVAKLVGEALEFGAVVANGEVTLLNGAKLRLQKHSTLEFVVAKMALDIGPEVEGGDVGFVDEVEDIGGDCGVNPIDKTTIDLVPFGRSLSSGCGGTNMSLKAKFAEHGVKTASPLAVVGGGVV
jgi:hypothetical protein